MDAPNALKRLLRAGIMLALAAFLAFGTLAGPLSAGQNEHHAASSIEGDHVGVDHAEVVCPSGHLAGDHEVNSDCCVGTCTAIFDVAAPAVMSVDLIGSIGPSFRPMAARPFSIEFLRPPSLTI